MSFMCQNDSYLTSFNTIVQSITPAKCKVLNCKGKPELTDGYEIILGDTVLFPEGGGQPDDRGTMNDISVLKVWRRGTDAIHFTQLPVEVGAKVDLQVDWKRRFDHMQQHSGQHLITAIIDQKFGYKTTSWDLGKTVSFIELDTPALSIDQMKEAEDICNEKIRAALPVTVHVTEVGSPLLQGVRARGLPDDHAGPVRIIEINGIDMNMCCGTHVKNMSHLMSIKLLSAEKGKKGKTNLYFLVGNRVLDYTGQKYSDEKILTKLLKCGAAEHVEAVDRSVKQLKLAQKVSTNLLREIAVFEAKNFKLNLEESKFLRLHRREGNNEYMNIIANEIGGLGCYLFLTVGDEKEDGLFLLSGPEEFLQECGKALCDLIAGKGATKGGRMQGKASKMRECFKVEEIIKRYIQTKGS